MDSPKDLLKYVGPAIGASAALYAVYKALQPKPTPPEGAVILVTGCDTGIGRATAEMLSEKVEGYRVLAGCLTDAGIENLSSLKRANLVPFKLDVSSDESVKAMLPMVEKECDGKGLFALYNIAGVLGGSVVDLTTMAVGVSLSRFPRTVVDLVSSILAGIPKSYADQLFRRLVSIFRTSGFREPC
jgi:NAD(P)-dependent dehydrogenase (short-subunit alcohol dehydrogenase family)